MLISHLQFFYKNFSYSAVAQQKSEKYPNRYKSYSSNRPLTTNTFQFVTKQSNQKQLKGYTTMLSGNP